MGARWLAVLVLGVAAACSNAATVTVAIDAAPLDRAVDDVAEDPGEDVTEDLPPLDVVQARPRCDLTGLWFTGWPPHDDAGAACYASLVLVARGDAVEVWTGNQHLRGQFQGDFLRLSTGAASEYLLGHVDRSCSSIEGSRYYYKPIEYFRWIRACWCDAGTCPGAAP